MQRGCISHCNFITDWTIILGEDIFAGLALVATCQLATTDLPECSHQPGPDFIFPNCLGRKMLFSDLSNTLGFQSGHFFTTMRLRTHFSGTLA